MRLPLRQLEAFRAVMEAGSVTEAARALGISQPAVSKMLQQAEDHLRFRLFTRERGRLTPTREARALLPELLKAFSAMEVVNRLAEDLQGAQAGLLTIAATPSLGNSLVPHAIARFHATRPRTRVALRALLNHEVVELVADHRVDLGVVLIPAEDSATLARHLCTADLVCVVPRDHPLARLEAVGPAELQQYPLVSFSRTLPIGALIEDAFQRTGLRRRIDLEVTQSATACSLVRAGAGIAVLDAFALMENRHPDLAVRPFTPAVRIEARVLLARHRPTSRLTEAFLRVLHEVVADIAAKGEIYGPGQVVPPLTAS